MNSVRTWISGLVIVLLGVVSVFAYSAVNTRNELTNEYSKVLESLVNYQTALKKEAALVPTVSESIKLLNNSDDAVVLVNDFQSKVSWVVNKSAEDLVKSTDIQKKLSDATIAGSKAQVVISNLKPAKETISVKANVNNKNKVVTNTVPVTANYKNAISAYSVASIDAAKARVESLSAIRTYNSNFESFSKRVVASLIGFYEIPLAGL